MHENGKWSSTDFDWIRTVADLQREMKLCELFIVKVYGNFIGDTILVSMPPAYRIETSNLLNAHDNSWHPEQIVSLCETLLDLTGHNINVTSFKEQALNISAIRNEVANLSFHFNASEVYNETLADAQQEVDINVWYLYFVAFGSCTCMNVEMFLFEARASSYTSF